ncbi:hypothetical protein [Ferrimonas lipolytica]|uniref:Uncharacterized protein n=1 Tax=Ferrimonas lipolytica TaxID=2724191 RepID=A0A6H1U9C5_9GAMM|nr:hypothetical protein [Ferrimonas lipolytica]QIZ75428.1 hypothetical protein HER31_10670 [Ferrimonas lipolytica]
MMKQFVDDNGKWLFSGNRDDLQLSRMVAKACESFAEDDEDEQIDDITRSCFNCAYRRWSVDSFHCLAPNCRTDQ